MFCTNCGNSIENDKFCPNCGQAVAAPAHEESVQTPQEVPDSYEPAWGASPSEQGTPSDVESVEAAPAPAPGPVAEPPAAPPASVPAPAPAPMPAPSSGQTQPSAPGFVSFGAAIKSGFTNFVRFEGRAPRSEYWFWQLFLFLASLGLFLFVALTAIVFPDPLTMLLIIYPLWSLAIFLPTLAMTVRRIRDAGLSPWLIFVALAPLGSLAIFVFTLLPSKQAAA